MKLSDRITIIIAFIIGVVLVVFLAATVYASPFLVCDPQAGVTSYQLTGWTQATVPAQPDGSIKMDVTTAAVGTTSLTVKACKDDAAWGVLCSEAVPFSLVRPSGPSIPTGFGLTP